MDKNLSDLIDSLTDKEIIEISKADLDLDSSVDKTILDKIQNATLNKAGFKTDEKINKHSIRRINKWQKIAALVACFTLIVCSILMIPNILNTGVPLPLDKSDKNIKVSVIDDYKSNSTTKGILVYYTEQELFDRADIVFYGTVESIDTIEIDFNGQKEYKSLITFSVADIYKGEYSSDSIKILTTNVISDDIHAEDTSLLQTLNVNTSGIFLVHAVNDDSIITNNNSTFYLSDVCNASFGDGLRFGFIKDEGFSNMIADSTFSNWDEVVEHVKSFTGE